MSSMAGILSQKWDTCKQVFGPDLGLWGVHHSGMEWKRVLSDNLRTLMRSRGHSSIKDVVTFTDGRSSNGTVGRILQGKGATVPHLWDLADSYRVPAGLLLTPGASFDKTRPPLSDPALHLAELLDRIKDDDARVRAYAICRLALTPSDEAVDERELLHASSPARASVQ